MTTTAISAQGSDVKVDIAATLTSIANVQAFSFDGQPSAEIDATNLLSTGKEYILGLQDFGSVTLDLHPDYDDAGQGQLRTLRASGAVTAFQVELPNTKLLDFSARVQNESFNGGVDAAFAGSFTLRVTGSIVVT